MMKNNQGIAWKPRLLGFALLIGGLIASSPNIQIGAEETQGENSQDSLTFVGKFEGNTLARIGLVVRGDAYVAYVCSQDEGFTEKFASWFKGKVKEGKIEDKKGDLSLEATVKNDKVEGSLSAADGKKMAFSAPQVPSDGIACIARAVGIEDSQEYVYGWVVDEDGFVAGAAQQKQGGRRTALKPPQNFLQNGLQGRVNNNVNNNNINNNAKNVINKKDNAKNNNNNNNQAVQGQRVVDPNNLPEGTKGPKIDQTRKGEVLQELTTRLKNKGGSPLQGMILQQMRRFLANKQPGTELEKRTFARLAKTNRNSLNEYLKLWDKLPQATRDGIVSPRIKQQLNENTALSEETGKALIGRLTPRPKAKQSSGVQSIEANLIRCIDESQPEALGSDEVFALYVVSSGNVSFTKTTRVYRGFDDGKNQPVDPADRRIWPPADQPNLVANEDVLVIASLFEDDSGGINALTNVLKTAADLGIILFNTFAENDLPAETGQAISDVLDAVAAAFPASQLLNSDTMVVRPDRSIRSINGTAKTELLIRKTSNGGGGPFDYRIQQINVK